MLVVSLLIALMRDQVASITAMGITATYISDKEDVGRKQAIKNGEFQIIFISPEAPFEMAKHPVYQSRSRQFGSLCG